MSVDTLNTLNALSEICARYGYDGAMKDDGPVEIGLEREHGNPILHSRLMDGFGMKLYGDKMCLSYHLDGVFLKEYYEEDIEVDLEQKLQDVKSFIEKEFRKLTGKSLGLKKSKDTDFEVTTISRVRISVLAKAHFTVGALSSVEPIRQEREKSVDKAIESFLSMKSEKRTKNDSRKSSDNVVFDPFKMKSGPRK